MVVACSSTSTTFCMFVCTCVHVCCVYEREREHACSDRTKNKVIYTSCLFNQSHTRYGCTIRKCTMQAYLSGECLSKVHSSLAILREEKTEQHSSTSASIHATGLSSYLVLVLRVGSTFEEKFNQILVAVQGSLLQ